MKQLLKENFVLVLGISLPVILIIVFMMAQSMTKLIDPPQYKAVFALQNQYYNNKPYKFEVDKNGKLIVTYKEPEDHPNRSSYTYTTRLYIYDPATDHAQEVELSQPEGLKEGKSKTIDVKEVKNLTIDTSSQAPDGYIFENHYSRNGNLFTEIFGYNRNRARYALKKEGRTIPIRTATYYYGHDHFIGWVVKEDK